MHTHTKKHAHMHRSVPHHPLKHALQSVLACRADIGGGELRAGQDATRAGGAGGEASADGVGAPPATPARPGDADSQPAARPESQGGGPQAAAGGAGEQVTGLRDRVAGVSGLRLVSVCGIFSVCLCLLCPPPPHPNNLASV